MTLRTGLTAHQVKDCPFNETRSYYACYNFEFDDIPLTLTRLLGSHRNQFKVYNTLSNGENYNETSLDASTLIGGLSLGQVDWAPFPMIPTEKRLRLVKFSTPFDIGRFCFFMARKWLKSAQLMEDEAYFLAHFSARIWLITIMAMVAYNLALGILGYTGGKHYDDQISPLSFLKAVVLELIPISFITLYLLEMKAGFICTEQHKLPFKSVKELNKLIERNGYKLIINKLNDFRMDLINNSNEENLVNLKHALYANNILFVPYFELNRQLRQIRNSFAINAWQNFRSENIAENSDIVEICLDEFPNILTSYAFAKHSKLLEFFNRHMAFVTEIHRKQSDRQDLYRRLTAGDNVPWISRKPIPLRITKLLFATYLGSMSFGIILLLFEFAYKQVSFLWKALHIR